MHTLWYVSTYVCGRMRKSASTLVFAEHVTNTLLYAGIRFQTANDPKILCLHKKSLAYADVLL